MKFIRMKVYPDEVYPDEILSTRMKFYPDEILSGPDEVFRCILEALRAISGNSFLRAVSAEFSERNKY